MSSEKLTCYRKGCGKEYYENENDDGVCLYHSGGPIFHEGLKGWSCCQKRVIDFNEFMQIHGCTMGRHSNEKPQQPESFSSTTKSADVNLVSSDGAVETYSTSAQNPSSSSSSSSSSSNSLPSSSSAPPRPVIPKEEAAEPEDDPADLEVSIGSPCRRKGCSHRYEGDKEATCIYHAGEPIFHEGSKGWSCCSRKVLEFEEFLKIKGCKTGRHRYSEPEKKTQVQVQCRFDWYQTQTQVILSLFAKNVKKDDSKITFEPYQVNVHIAFNNGDVFDKVFYLFEQINPEKSKFQVMSVKVEITLAKANGLSWASLEPTDKITQWTSFGVQGRVGTIGGKDIVYAGDSPIIPR